jgi:hypothetical protein
MNQLVPYSGTPAMTVSDVERVALAIAKGGLFGSKDPNAVLTLCLLAQAEGQHPAVVFRDYHIIQGKPAKKAEAMLRDFINAGGKVEWHRLDDEQADATFTHPSGNVRIDWTVERATKAGISTPMWKKYPRQMLRSRVISEGIRTVYPGATSGLYEETEVRDIVGEQERPTTGAGQDNPPVEDIGTGEDPPAKRQVLDGPYKSKTALWKAIKEFDRALRGMGDLAEFEAFLQTEEVLELLAQCERDAPQLLDTGEGLPEEYEPMNGLIARLRTDLANADETWRANPVLAG